MKVIVTGATGNAGREAVKHCLESPRITKLVILTRRAVSMDVESHPKAEVVMHQDFAQYPEALMRRLDGAQACIWAIGGRMDQFKNDKDAYRKVGVELPIAAARIFCEQLADKTPGGAKFRFVFCSSKQAEKTKKSLLFIGDARRSVGEAEKGLCEVADAHKTTFETYILRPASFTSPDMPPPPPASASRKLVGGHHASSTIETSQVGRAMVKVACDGWKDRVVENDALAKM
ncbi:hypothetical protein TOPH_05659 [Tolypocladium ophioglossoides CBS 100239]|uniref:NAD(P)-binding domain-containing protein n=1 Tax=Tolypocladium ophioglossoides (strain CBS 100239) TaxID=1163406 RepID=A0A0L0N6N1_TOLOC|nr:hypothetical protein TOPH_05659 [Tolypocladium ophioglossoides CBS 100239]